MDWILEIVGRQFQTFAGAEGARCRENKTDAVGTGTRAPIASSSKLVEPMAAGDRRGSLGASACVDEADRLHELKSVAGLGDAGPEFVVEDEAAVFEAIFE